MKAYSEDLRKKITDAVEQGMKKSEVARTFGVGLSTVKRYVAMLKESGSLVPKKRPGKRPKIDQCARRLLETDLKQRPASSLSQRRKFLARVVGVRVSEPTISRLLKRLGWSRKKDHGCQRMRRMVEGGLAGTRRPKVRRPALGLCRRDGREYLFGPPLRVGATWSTSILLAAAQSWAEYDAPGEHDA
jgi:transposase